MPAIKMAVPRQARVGLMKAGTAFLSRNNCRQFCLFFSRQLSRVSSCGRD
jgi:hypothetical protein